jgi:hypothetical protein
MSVSHSRVTLYGNWDYWPANRPHLELMLAYLDSFPVDLYL